MASMSLTGVGIALDGASPCRGSVRAMLGVMGLVLAEDPAQMSLVPDQRLVEEFGSGRPPACSRISVADVVQCGDGGGVGEWMAHGVRI
jgi:hypothetical protein